MKTLQINFTKQLILPLFCIFLMSSIPAIGQSLEGKWMMSIKRMNQVRIMEFTKDSAKIYEFDKRRAARPYHVEEGNQLVIDAASQGVYEFVNPHRLRLIQEKRNASTDLVRLKGTKTDLTKAEIEQLNFEITQDNSVLVNFDGPEDENGRTYQLEVIDSTYFLSHYQEDQRLRAIPIEEVNPEKIVLYGFPEKPFRVTGVRPGSNATTARISKASSMEDLNATEAIIGKWFYKHIEGRPALSDCTKKTFLQFTENSSLQTKPYAEDFSNGNCVAGSSRNATYDIMDNNQIKVIQNGTTEIWRIHSLTETELVVERDGSSLTLTKK